MSPTKATDARRSTLDASREMLGRDPLLRAVSRVGRHPLVAALAILTIYAAAYFGAGLWVNHAYADRTAEFIAIFEPEEIWIGVFLWLVFTPAVWAYYVWQPTGIASAIRSLQRDSKVVPERVDPGSQVSERSESGAGQMDLFGHVSAAVNHPKWVVLASAGTVVAIVVFLLLFENALSLSLPSFWYMDLRTRLLLYALYAINVYVLLGLAAKSLAISLALNDYFGGENPITAIHPLDPDGCGGYGALGAYAIRFSGLGILVGFWALFIALYPMLAGASPQLNTGTIIGYLVYLALTPLCLISPIWAARKAMVRFRDEKLAAISEALEEAISSSVGQICGDGEAGDGSGLECNVDQVEQLRQMHEIILAVTPVWPISVPSFRRFGLAASVPLLSGFLPVAVEAALAVID